MCQPLWRVPKGYLFVIGDSLNKLLYQLKIAGTLVIQSKGNAIAEL